MSRYFDTGLLVKVYVPEPNTAKVLETIRQRQEPVWFTPLHELELRNSVFAKQFRRELTAEQVGRLLAELKEDLQQGWLAPCPFDWERTATRAGSLSQRFTPQTGCRTLDILHVAAALEARASGFVTGDERQARLADLAKLTVTLIR